MTKPRTFNLGEEWTPNEKSSEIATILRQAIQPHEKFVKRFRKSYGKFTEAQLPKAAKGKAKKFAKLAAKLKTKQISLVEATSKRSPEQLDQLKHSVLVGYFFKRHFRFGINTITRILENSDSCANCRFILIFPANSNSPIEPVQTPAQTQGNASQKKQPVKGNDTKPNDPAPQATSAAEALSVSDRNMFNFFTRHIRIMCADLGVAAGYLDPAVSSSFLAKFFSINRISALALLAKSVENDAELPKYVIDDFARLGVQHGLSLANDATQPNRLLEYYLANKGAICQQVQSAIDSISSVIGGLLPKLERKSNFDKQLSLNKMIKLSTAIGEVKKTADSDVPMQLDPVEEPGQKHEQAQPDGGADEEVFGADFITFDKNTLRKNLATSFDDQNFILFNV